MSSTSDSNTAGPSRIDTESLLSFPAQSSSAPAPTAARQPRQVLKDRLYVGNLHPTVDEHTLIKLFSKFGKISKLDYLFHKTGLLKGKPRGYVFIEYANPEDAAKAIAAAHDKVLRGRKLVVTYATQAPADSYSHSGSSSSAKYRKGALEANRPTTLSLLKTSVVASSRNDTKDKIAKLEAKLRQLESSPLSTSPAASSSAHSSLPPKPSPAVTLPAFASQSQPGAHSRSQARRPSSNPNTQGATLSSVLRSGILPSVPPRAARTSPLLAHSSSSAQKSGNTGVTKPSLNY